MQFGITNKLLNMSQGKIAVKIDNKKHLNDSHMIFLV
jgi:peptidyl-tRNA hydrolase